MSFLKALFLLPVLLVAGIFSHLPTTQGRVTTDSSTEQWVDACPNIDSAGRVATLHSRGAIEPLSLVSECHAAKIQLPPIDARYEYRRISGDGEDIVVIGIDLEDGSRIYCVIFEDGSDNQV